MEAKDTKTKEKKETSKKDMVEVSKKNTNRSLVILIGIIGVTVVALVIGAVVFFGMQNKSSSLEIADAANPVEAFDRFSRQSILDTIDSLDTDNFDLREPASIIDFDSLQSDFNSNVEANEYLSISKPEEGSVVHQALDFEYSTKNSTEDLLIVINADIYEMANNNASIELNNLEDFVGYMNDVQTIDTELFTEVEAGIEGDILFAVGNEKLSFDYSIVAVEGKVYMSIENLEYDENILDTLGLRESGIDSIEEGALNFDFVEVLNVAQEYNLSNSSSSDLSSIEAEYLLNSYADQVFGSFNAEEEEQIEVALEIFKDEFSGFIEETELIVDIEEVDPIRSNSTSECFEGSLNTVDILDNGINMFGNILGKLANEPAFADQKENIELSLQQLESQDLSTEDLLDLVGFDLKMKACSDSSDKSFRGIGFDVESKASLLQPTATQFKFDALTVDIDSDKNIEKPASEGTDVTDEVINLLETTYVDNSLESTYYWESDGIEESVEELTENAPTSETPLISTVSNAEYLRSVNDSYKDAEDGDYVLLYDNYIVIYREFPPVIVYEGKI